MLMADNQAQSNKNMGSTSDHPQMEKKKGEIGDHKFEPELLKINVEMGAGYRLATVTEVLEHAQQVTKLLDNSDFIDGYNPDGYVLRRMLDLFNESQRKLEVFLQKAGTKDKFTFIECTKDNKKAVDLKELKWQQRKQWHQRSEQYVSINQKVYRVEQGLIGVEGDQFVDIDAEISHGYQLISFADFTMFASSENKYFQKKIDITYGPTTGGASSTWIIVQRSHALRLGDSRGIPFSYDDNNTSKNQRIRLQDGFIDTPTRLVWDQFCSKPSLVKKLVVRKAKRNENEAIQVVEKGRELVALLFACEFYEKDQVKQFMTLPNFADIILQNSINAPHQGSAFHLCASKGYTPIMRTLLEKLKDKQKALTATTDSPEKETPLMLAVLGGHGNIVHMLCEEDEKACNPYINNKEEEQQESSSGGAISTNTYKLDEEQEEKSKKELAVAKRPGVDLQNHQAAEEDRKERVATRSINMQTNETNLTALMMAAEHYMMRPSVWKPILECTGLDLSLINKRRNTVLHRMMSYSGTLKMKLFRPVMLKDILEKCGRKVSYKAYCTDAASLTWKVAKEVAEVYRRNQFVNISPTEALIDATEAVIDARDDMNRTPLHRALWFANIPKAAASETNLSDDADVASHGPTQGNPSAGAAQVGSNASNADADVASHGPTQGAAPGNNASASDSALPKNFWKQFQIYEVAAAPQSIREEIPIQLARLLISAGADIEAKDFRGQNALHIACELPDDAGTVRLLLCCFFGKYIDDEGRLQEFQSEVERRPFLEAQQAWTKYISTRDFFGRTPLHLAAQSGKLNVIRLLLDEDFNVSVDELIEMRDYDDKTILHFVATPSRHFEVMERVKIEIAKLILDVLPQDLKSLLLWSIGENLDVVDRYSKRYPLLSDYLEAERGNAKENILGLALKHERYDMVVELINRGAIITEKMRENAMIEYLLNTEKEYHRRQVDEMQPTDLDDNEIHFGVIFGWLKRTAYSMREKNVERAIKRRQRRNDEPELENIKELDKIQESHQGRTTDQPTNEDLLERGDIKYAISALLLNQHMGSPITLGILGDTGMGKSSMMLQVEHSLLSRAAMETLSPALQSDKKSVSKNNYFTGAKKEPNRLKKHAQKLLVELKGVFEELEDKERYHRPKGKKTIDLNKPKQRKSLLPMLMDKATYHVKSFIVSKFEAKDVVIETMEQKIQKYIMQYNEMHTWIAKRIALANVGDNVPGIVTVQYDAWQYENKDEAWAGLAVAILKEMEISMPKADLLRASFMYSYRKNPTSATMKLAIPIIIYFIVGCIVASALFSIFSLPKVPNFLQPYKYASIPLSILVALWRVMVRLSSYIQPISESLIEQTRSLQNDHLAKVGYQHQVIQDVTYLKTCISTNMSFSILWWGLATILNIASGSSYLTTKSEASDRLKYLPKGKKFRIIVFIDNLDRQKEELFTPLNIILKACDINAVVAIDKGSIEDVPNVENTTCHEGGKKNENTSTIVTKRTTLLQQLIQIPIVLPEPDVYDLANTFLDEHLKNFESKKDKFVHKKTAGDSTTSSRHPIPASSGDSMRSSGRAIPASSSNGASTKNTSGEATKEGSSHQGIASKTQYTTTQLEEIQINVSNVTSTSRVNIQAEPLSQNDGLKDEKIFQENKNIQEARVEEDNRVKHKLEDPMMTEGKVDKEKIWQAMNTNVLDTNYSRGEIEVFKYLAKHTYGYYRSPRAWKSLLNYHRLVRSVMTYTCIEFDLRAWKRQLVIWVFLCWQWKDEMNEIFQNWEQLTAVSLKSLSKEELPSEERRILTQEHIRHHDKSLEVQTLTKKELYDSAWAHINVIYASLSKIVKKHMDTSKPTKTTWTNLQRALSVGDIDVYMRAMQAFRKYRFDCDSGPLTLILND